MLEKSILSIKMTNKKWLATILMLLNSRDNSKSSVKVINDSKKQKKIYRLDSSLNQARIDEYNMDKEHNIVEIVDGTGVGYIYDSFSGEFILEKYLEEEKSFEEIEKLFDTNLFTGKEKRVLNKYVFDKSFEEEKDKKIRIRK